MRRSVQGERFPLSALCIRSPISLFYPFLFCRSMAARLAELEELALVEERIRKERDEVSQEDMELCCERRAIWRSAPVQWG